MSLRCDENGQSDLGCRAVTVILVSKLFIKTCKARIQKTHSVIAVCFNNFPAYFFARDEVPKDCQSQQFHSDGLLGCRAFLVCDHNLVGVDGILKAAFL